MTICTRKDCTNETHKYDAKNSVFFVKICIKNPFKKKLKSFPKIKNPKKSQCAPEKTAPNETFFFSFSIIICVI